MRRAARNRAVRSEVKTKVVKARRALSEAPVAESDRYAMALEAVRALDRAASKGVLHRNNAARRKARLTRQIAKLAIAPVPTPSKGKKATGPAAKPAKSGASGRSAAPAKPAVSAKPAAASKKK